MATLGRDELLSALARLGQLAAENGDLIQLLVVGGTIMVLELNTRDSTKDVAAFIINDLNRPRFESYVSQVASEKAWPPDWINDAAKGFVVGPVRMTTVFSSAGIELVRPEFVQLLAMKLCAWRDEVDFADAVRLLRVVEGERDAVWAAIEPHLYPGSELKARYAFEDVWEFRRP